MWQDELKSFGFLGSDGIKKINDPPEAEGVF